MEPQDPFQSLKMGPTYGYFFIVLLIIVIRCAIWYHLYYLKNVQNTHGGMLLLEKLQAKSMQLY